MNIRPANTTILSAIFFAGTLILVIAFFVVGKPAEVDSISSPDSRETAWNPTERQHLGVSSPPANIVVSPSSGPIPATIVSVPAQHSVEELESAILRSNDPQTRAKAVRVAADYWVETNPDSGIDWALDKFGDLEASLLLQRIFSHGEQLPRSIYAATSGKIVQNNALEVQTRVRILSMILGKWIQIDPEKASKFVSQIGNENLRFAVKTSLGI